MREILFKAKRESNRKWVEGYYYKENFLTGKSVQHFIRGKDDTDKAFSCLNRTVRNRIGNMAYIAL